MWSLDRWSSRVPCSEQLSNHRRIVSVTRVTLSTKTIIWLSNSCQRCVTYFPQEISVSTLKKKNVQSVVGRNVQRMKDRLRYCIPYMLSYDGDPIAKEPLPCVPVPRTCLTNTDIGRYKINVAKAQSRPWSETGKIQRNIQSAKGSVRYGLSILLSKHSDWLRVPASAMGTL